MLVLSRKFDESIVINPGPNQITVRVIDIRRGKVKVGIDAPSEVRVMRNELAATATAAVESAELMPVPAA